MQPRDRRATAPVRAVHAPAHNPPDPHGSPGGPQDLRGSGDGHANAETEWDPRLYATIAILCGALFLDAMDISSVNVALPTIGSHLRMSASTLQWVVSGYVLGYGGF